MGDEAATAVAPVRVFMSYRRADDRHFIGRLHDRLCEAFGDEMVFRDIDSIPAGTNFRNVILRTLNEVDAVVAVIGPNWAPPSDRDDTAATDYVFMELAEALKFGKPVIPVLMETTLMPSADALPPELRSLSDIEAISVLADPAFRRDSARLIEAIGRVVADDRARLARAQRDAEEHTRRLAAERLEREQRAEQLRAEERAARARLAELEQAAARREIELERARVEELAAELRQAESADEAEPTVAVRAVEVHDVSSRPAPAVEQPRDVPPSTPAESPQGVAERPAPKRPPVPWFEILIVAALVLGALSLSVKRSVVINESVFQFDELGGSKLFDVVVWLFVLVIGVPMLLSHRRVEQRFVLAGVTVSLFVFEILQEAAIVRYGLEGFDEGSWFVVKLVQIACLVVAYQIVRRRPNESPTPSQRLRLPLLVIAIAGGVLTAVATGDEWSHTSQLVDSTFVPGRSPIVVWFVLVALPPVTVTVAMAARGTYAAQGALATIATLAALNYFTQVKFLEDHDINGSLWAWTSLSYLLLAGVAWWAVIGSARTTRSPA